MRISFAYLGHNNYVYVAATHEYYRNKVQLKKSKTEKLLRKVQKDDVIDVEKWDRIKT